MPASRVLGLEKKITVQTLNALAHFVFVAAVRFLLVSMDLKTRYTWSARQTKEAHFLPGTGRRSLFHLGSDQARFFEPPQLITG